MLLRKDNRAFVVPITPGVIQDRLREMKCMTATAMMPDFFTRFVILGHCLMVVDMPNEKLAVAWVKPKDEK